MQKFILHKWHLVVMGLFTAFLFGLVVQPNAAASTARQNTVVAGLHETQTHIIPIRDIATADADWSGSDNVCIASKLAAHRLSCQTDQQISRRRMMVEPENVIEPYNTRSFGQIARSDSHEFTAYSPADYVLPDLFTAF